MAGSKVPHGLSSEQRPRARPLELDLKSQPAAGPEPERPDSPLSPSRPSPTFSPTSSPILSGESSDSGKESGHDLESFQLGSSPRRPKKEPVRKLSSPAAPRGATGQRHIVGRDIYGNARPAKLSSRFSKPEGTAFHSLVDDGSTGSPALAPVLVEYGLDVHGEALQQTEASDTLLSKTRVALRSGGGIEAVDFSSVNGVYVVKDFVGKPVAIFKPEDEEQGLSESYDEGRSLTEQIALGCPAGQSAKREYMAYMLDHQAPPCWRAGVPPTTLIRLSHPFFRNTLKVGSLQAYVENHKGPAEDWGASSFDAGNVQRIALFDLRTLNLDRHGGNCLVDAAGDLVPIDHGYCLPEHIGEPWFDWRLWPQAATQLDSSTCSFVETLDPLAAQPLAARLGLGDGVWRTMAVMTLWLQASIAAGLSLRRIADATMRWTQWEVELETTHEPVAAPDHGSVLEKIGQQLYLADNLAEGRWSWPSHAAEGTWTSTAAQLIEVEVAKLIPAAA